MKGREITDVNNMWLAKTIADGLGLDPMDATDFATGDHRASLLLAMRQAAVDYARQHYRPPYQGEPVAGKID